MIKPTDEQALFAAMGRAAYLPGMVYMVEQMQHLVDDFRAKVNELQNGAAPRKKVGRPAKKAPVARTTKGKQRKAPSYGWPADPEARKKEMARRLALGRKRAKAAGVNTVRELKEAAA